MLGNDVEDESAGPAPVPKEIVKKTGSSKKLDVPPPKADPAKAKKNKKPLPANEAALKNKNSNRDVDAPASTPANRYKKPFDRHSRAPKTDSKKKVKQGWGSADDSKQELDDETNATGDAVNELAADAADKNQPAPPAAKSLQEYLAELQATEAQLAGKKTVRAANDGDDSKWAEAEKLERKTEEFVPSTVGKKQKQKQAKDKKFLDFSAVFADEVPRLNDRRGPKGAKGPKGKAQKPAVDYEHNFPKLA